MRAVLLGALGRASLARRIVGASLALLLAVQAASFVAIRAAIDRNARASIHGDLEVGERALTRLLAQQASRLTSGATLLAADYGFREAVATGDAETVVDALANHGRRIGATVAALLDPKLEMRASSRVDLPDLPVRARRLLERSGRGTAAGIAVIDGRPMQFVLVPLKAPALVGYVLMGFGLDDGVAADLRRVTGLHLAVLTREGEGDFWSNPIGTLPGAASTPMVARLGAAVPGGTLYAGNEEFSARMMPLTEPGETQAVAVLMRSVDEAVAPYLQLQWALAATTLLGLAAFALGSVYTARRITTPVRRLVAAAERLGQGDYATPVRGGEGGDEIGDLALAFEAMRGNIAEQQERMLDLAYRDPLTQLPNRACFREGLRAAIERADPARDTMAVLVFGLDRFRLVNDVLGYRIGDLLLKGVAERLKGLAGRAEPSAARLGGDEFALLLPGCTVDTAQRHAAELARALEVPLVLEEHTLDVAAGIGIACWPQHAGEADTLLSRAEIAMVAAKRKHEGVQLYDAAIDAGSAQSLSLLSELRHALEHGELRLFLQPKVALDDGRVCGAEALLRWQHPTRGMVPPGSFIPFAEQTGFVRHLTLWIFEAVAREWEALHELHGQPLSVSVNLSTHDLLDPLLPSKLRASLRRHGVPAEAFCLEITESAMMDDPQRAEGTLRALSAEGFRLSIDDFGTGYSSLAYLKRLPVCELKIDRSFVMGMERDTGDATIVRSTIDLAHNLGLTVVAEGVENAAIWNHLHRLNCDEAQGYHMSKPLPVPQFIAWCQRWSDRAATGWAGLAVH